MGLLGSRRVIISSGRSALETYIAAQLPRVPSTRRGAIAQAARSAASNQGGTPEQIIDALAACIAWWYVDTVSCFQNTSGLPSGLNDPVGQLNDWVGIYNGTQSTSGSKPTLTSQGLYFDGGDSLDIAAGSAGGSGDCTFLVVAKTAAGDASNGVLLGWYSDAHVHGLGQVFFREADANARTAATGAFTVNQWYLTTGQYENGVNCRHRRGSGAIATGAVATGVGRGAVTSGSIGGANTSGGPPPSLFLTGYWLTGLITSSVNSTTRDKLSRFLSDLTGLGVF